MERVISYKRWFGGMEEMRYPIKEYLNQNCQRKPDFIEDVLFQKDLYSSYNVIQENPAHEPTYTFADADSPSTECNPMSLFNEVDTQQPLVTREHGVISEADCSYGTNKGDNLLTVDPTFDPVLEDRNYEEIPPTQVWQEDMNVNLVPESSGANNEILREATFGLCMDRDGEGIDLAVTGALQLAMDDGPMERTIDVSDYEVEPFIPVVQEGINIDLAELKAPHIDNQIITELDDHGIDPKWGFAELDFSDLPQLSMDAIQMESILEGPDYEEVSFMHVDCDNMNIDLLGQIISGIDNNKVSEPIDHDIDQNSVFIDMDNSAVMRVNNNAIPIEQTAEMSGLISDRGNQEVVFLERHIDSNPIPLCNSPGKPSVEGQSCSKSPMDSRGRHRRSRSRSHSRCRSPVKSRDHSRRSRSRPVSDSMNSHRISRSHLQSTIYSKDHDRRSYPLSRVNSRDSHRRSQLQLKFGRSSRDCNNRTWSRSTSTSHSQSSMNSRDVDRRSRRRSPINLRDIQRPSPRRNQPRQLSLTRKQRLQHRSFQQFPPLLTHHLSSPRPVCRAPA